MARKNVVAIVSAVGFLTAFVTALMTAVTKRGGSEEDIYRLSLPEGQALIDQFAELIVKAGNKKLAKTFRVVGNFDSIAKAVTAGDYGSFFGYPRSPEGIKGVTAHSVDADVELAHLERNIITKELVAQLPNLVDLVTLLAFGAQHPDVQRKFPIVTVWQDETGQFWYALLSTDGAKRHLSVSRNHPHDKWNGYHFRFLVSK